MRISKPPEQRKAELLAAARELFDENGIEATRVSDIVQKVGVAQGVFYYYFKSKQEIVQQVVQQVAAELEAQSAAILGSETDFPQKLTRYIRLYTSLVDQFLADDAADTSTLQAALAENLLFQQSRALLRSGWRQLIEAGAQQGAIRLAYPAETADVLLLGLEKLAFEKLPGREMLYTIIAQTLGLAAHSLPAE